RSRARAAALARALGLDVGPGPDGAPAVLGAAGRPLPGVITVVGSKGKGTAACFASAALHAAGLRVGTITSPALRTNAERVRLNGTALDDREYRDLSRALAGALERLGPPTAGYLSPAGAYLMAGVARLTGALGPSAPLPGGDGPAGDGAGPVDVLVLEEGMGGAGDEVSLFVPTVVALTPVFAEHLGVLGHDVEQIAEELLGVVRPGTARVRSTRQTPPVHRALEKALRRAQLPEGAATRLGDEAVREAADTLGPGLTAPNAALGLAAAGDLLAAVATPDRGTTADDGALAVTGWPRACGDSSGRERVLRGVGTLPGRMSVHPPTEGRPGVWIVDCAVDPVGVRAAVSQVEREHGEPSLVLACFPDGKDPRACFAALPSRYSVVPVTAGTGHLSYLLPGPPAPPVRADSALREANRTPGVVLCLGTVSFVAEVLEHLDADTRRWWP
ncbi:MAG: dihydrofolate synthase / folylpolyglutamate synthase, partial [Actinomycetota bacterium]|nr:dihydrofolate synthase / folylpolyglutamate synthase [Actinomycetota bacterium]